MAAGFPFYNRKTRTMNDSILVICQELFEKDFNMHFGKKGNFNRPSALIF